MAWDKFLVVEVNPSTSLRFDAGPSGIVRSTLQHARSGPEAISPVNHRTLNLASSPAIRQIREVHSWS
jgi:hypothetical protein